MTQGQILPAVVEGRLGVEAEGAGLVTPEELRDQLVHLRERKALVVLLVDVSDVSGSFLPRVRDLIGPNPVLLVGTKADLLPRGTEQDKVLEWMACVLAARLNVLDARLLSAKTGEGIEEMKDFIFDNLGFMSIYLKPQGQEADLVEPLIVKDTSTVRDVCAKLHRDFLRKFRYARVKGPSAKFDWQRVGLDHLLKDDDILTIILRKS